MRQIGSLDNEHDARRFGAYLLTQGVKNSVEEGAGGAWSVWVEDDDLLDRVRAALEAFRPNRADPRYDAAVGRAEKLRKAEENDEQRRRRQFVDVRTRWGQPAQLARPVTVALVSISVLVAVLTLAGSREGPVMNALRIAPTESIDERRYQWDHLNAITHGQVWRLVTPIFLHFGAFHLIFNMFWLLDLGAMVETRRGSRFLVLFVLATAVASNLAEYYWPPVHPMFGGMSGVVYGLFGYVWIKGRYQPHLGMGVSQQTVTVMLVWLVVCMVPGFPINVANTAHVVGLLSGVAFAYVPYAVKRLRRGR